MNTESTVVNVEVAAKVGIIRRITALMYDLFLVAALLVAAAAFVVLPAGMIFDTEIAADNPLYRLYLLAWPVGFYLWFWTHGGQTLGMRAWHFRVVRSDGEELSLVDAIKRLLAALLSIATAGIGFLWAIFDKDNKSLHDHLSGTTVVMLEKRKKAKSK